MEAKGPQTNGTGLSREDLMAIATMIATTLQGSDRNNGGEGPSNNGTGLSREDLMAIATMIATTLQGLVGPNHNQAPPPNAQTSQDEERSAGARRPAGELRNDDISSNVSNQQEATVQTRSWYLKLAIAKRCRLNKSIRQRFAFALKIQQMAYQSLRLEKKPAATQIKQRRKFSSDANSAATHIQQQGFSNANSCLATRTSSSPRSFRTQVPWRKSRFLVQETSPVKFEKMSHAYKADRTL
ncbi:hypothetical protein F511_31830 [Dorcoceras hygrometricum]|uniref:Uncharacterized protein n=1 Tax=Dorcoceras hygrometricum TaxID=472368 RepID=A0A2Z7DDX2_9LAMI|nr:hypothetical protein F511_31830 [Dorcoceras hygrometricum]